MDWSIILRGLETCQVENLSSSMRFNWLEVFQYLYGPWPPSKPFDVIASATVVDFINEFSKHLGTKYQSRFTHDIFEFCE